MGILGLSRLIGDIAPDAIKELELKSLFGRRVAIDASMCLYQFMIAIRSQEYTMTNADGETTSHLVGFFYRTIKLMELGIKPVYVFDGKAPKLKCGELAKRAERRDEARGKLEEAKEVQNIADIQRFNKRLVRVTGKHNADCKRLLELLGIPCVQAPSEAEAQCAQLCKEGLVYAAATEDMDSLTFGCPRLVRNLTSANNDKVKEFTLSKALDGLGLNQDQFVDLSILMGCDYCDSIKGIGGKTGLELIKKHGSIEKILEHMFGITEFVEVEIEYKTRIKPKEEDNDDKATENNGENIKEENGDDHSAENEKENNKEEDVEAIKEEVEDIKLEDTSVDEGVDGLADENNDEDQKEEDQKEEEQKEEDQKKPKKKGKRELKVPENWPFRGARKLFQEPLVVCDQLGEADLKMKDADEEGVIKFLVEENGFSEERVRGALKRIKNCKAKSSQTRIDSFFKASPAQVSSSVPSKQGQKRDNKAKPITAAKRGRGRGPK